MIIVDPYLAVDIYRVILCSLLNSISDAFEAFVGSLINGQYALQCGDMCFLVLNNYGRC